MRWVGCHPCNKDELACTRERCMSVEMQCYCPLTSNIFNVLACNMWPALLLLLLLP